MECSKHSQSGEHEYLTFGHSQSAICGQDWNGRFLTHYWVFFRRITKYKISWCSAAVRLPLLWLSLPRYQGEMGAAPCQEQVLPVSSNQPNAGHRWVPQTPWRVPQGKCVSERTKNACRATRDEGKMCKKQLWKYPGHPRRWEVVPSALEQDSLAAHRGPQP